MDLRDASASKNVILYVFLKAQTLAAIFAGCNLPFLFMCLAMPESPSYLVSKGKVSGILINIILDLLIS